MNQFDQRVAAVRQFNRFYTRQIGVLREKPYKRPLSLTEVRVLYELAHRESSTATELCDDLGLDPGYLSRVLTGFDKRGWSDKKPRPSFGLISRAIWVGWFIGTERSTPRIVTTTSVSRLWWPRSSRSSY